MSAITRRLRLVGADEVRAGDAGAVERAIGALHDLAAILPLTDPLRRPALLLSSALALRLPRSPRPRGA